VTGEMLGGTDAVIVTMRVECATCGHSEADSYEFDMPADNAEPAEHARTPVITRATP
jgi:hypothetical protein